MLFNFSAHPQGRVAEKDDKVDSVINANHTFLKDQLERRSSPGFLEMNNDSLQLYFKMEDEAIRFFEDLTRIKADIIHNYALSKTYDAQRLEQWKAWTVKNHSKLKWDKRKSKVVRSDK